MVPDYSLYNLDYSVGYTSRGCIRSCPFCIVNSHEGPFHVVGDIHSFWNRSHKRIVIMDNNILADKAHFLMICSQLRDNNLHVTFEQGLDIRLVDEWVGSALKTLKYYRYTFSWDSVLDERAVLAGIKCLTRFISPFRLVCNVLVGFDSTIEEDIFRINSLHSLGISPFCMVYERTRATPLVRLFQRFVNSRFYSRFSFYEWLTHRKDTHLYALWSSHVGPLS